MGGVLWGLVSGLLFGTADFMAARSSKRVGAYTTLWVMQLTGFVLLTVMMIAFQEWRWIDSGSHVLSASVWMLLDLAGILFLYRGLQVGLTVVVAPVASSFSAVTAAIALMFGERVSPLVLCGILLTLAGVIGVTLAGSASAGERNPRVSPTRGALWAAGAALLLGVAFYGMRDPALAIGGMATVWIGRLQASVLLPLAAFLAKRRFNRPRGNVWGLLCAVGVLDALAIVCYNVGLREAQTSIVITAASLFAVFTLLWGVLIAKERPALHQWGGIALTFIGIAIVSQG
ncbi:DMT family transporter [Cohnella caldifontis]|uniref:DMT family transporter n=1 Tax=Cohnella caldifontis TaxID=3027471 RepID=UPI0023EB86DC|nr:DMT family transporter [Cohnella sp. YIM B05605]